MSKDFRDIKREAERQGWVVEPTKNGHWKFFPPDPQMSIVFASGTPSDRRAIDSLIGDLRRSGFQWPRER